MNKQAEKFLNSIIACCLVYSQEEFCLNKIPDEA